MLELVNSAVLEHSNPDCLFKMISSFYGIKEVGHPGIYRKAQILALKPYLKLISVHCLARFSEECNEQGWYEIRRKLFDGLDGCERSEWSEKQFIAELDQIHERTHSEIYFLLDREIEKGVTWEQCRDVLLSWYTQTKTLAALEMVNSGFKHMGTRSDLELVHIFPEQDQDLANVILADMLYAVKYRSFN